MSPLRPTIPTEALAPPFACTGCGYRVAADRPFCRYCGQRLAGPGRYLALDQPDWPPRLEGPTPEAFRFWRPQPLPPKITAGQGVGLLLLALACFPLGAAIGCALLIKRQPEGARLWGLLALLVGLSVPVGFLLGVKATGGSLRSVTELAELLPWLQPDPADCCQVDDVRIEEDKIGRFIVRGIVRNRTSRPILRLHLTLGLQNKQGVLLQECEIPVAGPEVEEAKLPPYEAARFNFVLPREIEWDGDYTVSFHGLKLGWP